jgi:ribosomal protein S20
MEDFSEEIKRVLDPRLSLGEANKFSVEINSSGIPFDYAKRSTYVEGPVSKSTSMTWIDTETNKITRTQTTVEPIKGNRFPGALAQDVLTVLMSLAIEQKSDQEEGVLESGRVKVWFTLSDICKRLRISKGNTTKVKRAIDQLDNITVHFKDFICDEENYETENIKTKIITRSGSKKTGRHGDSSDYIRHRMWIELDGRVAKSLFDGFYGTLKRDVYLKLSSGASRKVYSILCSKRRVEGDRFYVDLDDLGYSLDLKSTKSKIRYSVKKYIEAIHSECKDFQYYYTRSRGQSLVKIVFDENSGEEEKLMMGTFYEKIAGDYGVKNISELGISRYDIERMVDEHKDAKATKFNGSKVSSIELSIDVALHQAIRNSYPVASIKGLVRSMIKKIESGEGINVPDNYYDFINTRIDKRLEERLKIEVEQKRVEKKDRVERERTLMMEKSAVMLQSIKRNNPAEYECIRREAESRVWKDNESPEQCELIEDFSKFAVNQEMVQVVYEDVINGNADRLRSEEKKRPLVIQ